MNQDLKGLLLRRLEEEGMPPGVPITVAELHRRLLPYGLCRERLGYASKAEYDIGMLRMLSDERAMVVPEGALVEAVRRELDTPEPGLALLQRFAASEIRVRFRRPVEGADGGNAGPASGGPGARETGPPIASHQTGRPRERYVKGLDDPLLVPLDEAADALGMPTEEAAAPAARPAAGPAAAAGEGAADPAPGSASCRSCGRTLPDRRGVRYCPACGADQERWPCPACGEEVERGWSYCALCGKLLRT